MDDFQGVGNVLPPPKKQHKQVQQTQQQIGVSKNSGTPKWMVYNGKPY